MIDRESDWMTTFPSMVLFVSVNHSLPLGAS